MSVRSGMYIPMTGAHFSASWNEKLTVLSASMATFLLGFEEPSVCRFRFLVLSILSAIVGGSLQIARCCLGFSTARVQKNLEGRCLQMPTFQAKRLGNFNNGTKLWSYGSDGVFKLYYEPRMVRIEF